MKHASHEEELRKLNRTLGQLEGIRRMIENQRYCVEILQQLKAVRSSIKSIEQGILKKHMQTCLLNAAKNNDSQALAEKIEELQKTIIKYQ